MIRVLSACAGLSPVSPEPSSELREALSFLDDPVAPETVVEAGYGIGLLGLAATGSLWLVSGGLTLPMTLGLAAIVASAVHVVHTLPQVFARARETRALGELPDLVLRVVLSMRLSPATERATSFAAETGEGPLARSLTRHVRRATLEGGDAILTFADEWEHRFPAVGRAATLVTAAGEMPAPDRERTLDRALTAVLDGMRDEMMAFAGRIRRPVTALYAFGVLLPTALVALLPAASAAGVGVTIWTVGLVYDLLLPAILTVAGGWLVTTRPVAFPPPTVERAHPDVSVRAGESTLLGLAVGVTGWATIGRALPAWGGPFFAVSFGCGTALWHYYRPVVAVYRQVRAVETGLTDALSLVGRHVANGCAIETAIERTATDLDGEVAEVFERAAIQQRQLKVSVEASFLGEYGALADLPSPRTRGSVALLSLAATKGTPVGPALLRLAEHVDDLARVEADARRDLDAICGTLETTGAAFGPMVAGSTVALADGIAAGSKIGIGGSLPGLGFVVGGYVFASAVLLTGLATALTRGFDRALVGIRAGRALVLAGVIYPLSYLLVSGLV